MYQITQMISELSRSRRHYLTERMQPYGLKGMHAMNLILIGEQPGISQDALARQRQTDKSNIARHVAALEEEGYITRCPCDADKRVMKLYPTEKAMELLPVITEILARWETQLTQEITQQEKAILLSVLQRMKQSASWWEEEN